ncbi:hypothetical protein M431DRAFT_511753 [Trichoderma harzianum CBS 226.95]|uniref:Uncharacterized protein n=1 Tax=Trichoderma harzianum CBS 226.95 TaxID=983964 RepID=A0A2T4A1E6_TRIHA|nr:hypothetical protein M431DRAFT_511753 [Trichoderma harzianum CBS 226.95]PTB50848.1 hypothetical protein M431DRAFT_511753 [Trichoderma harzianum CBS 226.95]
MQIATYDVIYWKSDITPLVSALKKLLWPVSKWTNTHFGFAILSTLCDVASWLAYTLLYSSSKWNDRLLIAGQNVTENDRMTCLAGRKRLYEPNRLPSPWQVCSF